MNIIQKQVIKEKALEYLVSKGYKLKMKITDRKKSPSELQSDITTRKICLFTLTDPKCREVIDQFVAEYSAIPSEWESKLRNLTLRD